MLGYRPVWWSGSSTLDLTLVNDIKARPFFSLADYIGAVREGLHAHDVGQLHQLVLRQFGEERHALQDTDAHSLGQQVLHRAQQQVELHFVQ